MSKKKLKKKNKKDSKPIEQGFNQIKDANSIKQDSDPVEKKSDSSNILGNSNVRALITALTAAVVEQLLELLINQENDSKDERDRLSKLGDAIKQDSNPVEKKFNSSNILGNSSVRALITALAVAAVEQLLEAIAKQGNNFKDGETGLSKLGDAIKEAASSLQEMASGKSGVAETVATVKDAIAEIKPAVAGVVPVVQGVVSALKDKAEDSKTAVQAALPEDMEDVQNAVNKIRPASQS